VSGVGPPPPPPPPPPARKCRVPKLKGKTLSQARTALTKANCKLGKVTKPKARKHHKLRKLVVKSTSPGPGAVKPLGTKVAVTLVQVPKPKHHK
jgi:beta-lactam-binding protein with PASTA domain